MLPELDSLMAHIGRFSQSLASSCKRDTLQDLRPTEMPSKTCTVANTSLASNVVAYLVPPSIREGASCLVITLAVMLLRIELCLKAVRCSGGLRTRRIVKLQADTCGALRRRNVRGSLDAVTKYCRRIRDAIAEEGATADYGLAAWFQQHI